ncbi:ABC transporter ATP-binding protein [Clostridia bacterium]|nr:ABC transporter ATP-binding protein [Clostridia bacterium]
MSNVLEIKDLRKSFGKYEIIRGLNLIVPAGSIYGFIGQNGAGKTTTMKMVLGLLRSDGGEITVCGERVTVGGSKANQHIGFLQDVPEFYGFMRPGEYLALCGEVTGMKSDDIRRKSNELLNLVGLKDVNKKIGGFSRGMKQRLGIAQALINEPKLLICDEPTSALDPVGRKEILDIMMGVRGKTTVIFSTHVLSDVERICDRVAILSGGIIAKEGDLRELRASYESNAFTLEFADDDTKNRFLSSERLGLSPANSNVTENAVTIFAEDIKSTAAFVLEVIAADKILPKKFEIHEPSLEKMFLEVVSSVNS